MFCLPASAWASSENGTFTLAVGSSSGTGYEVAPVNLSYEPGATLREALEASPYGFVFSSDGFISKINNTACLPVVYYTGGYRDGVGYNVPAAEVEAMFITLDSGTDALSEEHTLLLQAMGSYLDHGANIRNYADAKSAYDAAYSWLPRADADKAGTLYEVLQNAIDTYDSILNGTKYDVDVITTQSGSPITNTTITLTDSYGNVTSANRYGHAQVVAGTYVIEAVSSNGYYAGKKTVTIDASTTNNFKVVLPTGGWLGEVKVLDKTSGTAVELPSSGSAAAHQLTFYVPDYMSQTGNLYISPNYATSAASGYRAVAIYERIDTQALYENPLSWNSQSHSLNNLLKPGMVGATATLEVRKGDLTPTVEIERTPASFVRTPTLSALSVTCDGAESLTGFLPYTYEYETATVSDEAVVRPTPFGTADEGYSATVNGQPLDADGTAIVALTSGDNDIEVVVSHENGQSNTYTVTIDKRTACTVTLTHEIGVTVAVTNAAGGTLPPSSSTDTSDTYELIPGVTYTYVSTAQDHYHATNTFEATEGGIIATASPRVETWIENMKMKRGTLQTADYEYELQSRSEDGFEYSWIALDTATASWLIVTSAQDAPENLEYEATWLTQKKGVKTATSGTWSNSGEPERTVHKNLSGLIEKSGYPNSATFTATDPTPGADGETYYQDFALQLNRRPTLSSLSMQLGGQTLQMVQTATIDDESPTAKFAPEVFDYTVSVPVSASSLDLKFIFQTPAPGAASDAWYVGGYTVQVGASSFGYDPSQPLTAHASLRAGDMTTETIQVVVSHADPLTPNTVYLINVVKLPATTLTVNIEPADATFVLLDDRNNARIWPNASGVYSLSKSLSYTWTAGAVGYVGQTGNIVLDNDMSLSVELEVAPRNTDLNTEIEATWPGFRLGDENGSIMDTPTPTTADDTVLFWAEKLGQGYSSGAAGCPTLVDGYLYAYGTSGGSPSVFKLDVVSGETVAQGSMVSSSSFSLTPTTYAEGMIFVALAGGRVEAFDAQTLESLWVYVDPLGGQPNCPIIYKDGCIYTGFWNSYTSEKQANFVCLTVTDEHPSQPGHHMVMVNGKTKAEVVDAKTALWTHAMPAGYYWAGACAGEGYVLMGCDDGWNDADNLNGPGNLFSFDSKTGRIIDEFHDFTGDVRTTITYDVDTGFYYFMTKNGRIDRIKVNSDGTFVAGSFASFDFSQTGQGGIANCTSTPAILNGRAYVGVMGTGQFSSYGGATTMTTAVSHRISVVDLATFTEVYSIDTQGYPQTTPLISSHYVDDDGYAYVYFIENITPGKVRVIRDKPGMTEADAWSSAGEMYTDKNGVTHPTARVLFCPDGPHAQYAICSPIADETGTIYFKNDSAFMMALGPTVNELRITAQPGRTEYAVGEAFDPTGLKAELVYSNGTVRDVSNYLEYSVGDRALTLNDRQVVVTFPYVLYQNDYQHTLNDPVAEYPKPSATLQITVKNKIAPVVMTSTLPDAEKGKSYTAPALEAAPESDAMLWRVSSGTLPAGLSLNATTGVISGTATVLGTYEFAVTATNTEGTSAPKTITMRVVQEPQISKPNSYESLQFEGYVGDSFEYQCEASGYPQPIWAIATGEEYAMPPGIAIDAVTGLISGTYTKAGQYEFRVRAENEVGLKWVTRVFRITVMSLNPPEITTTELPVAKLGETYTATLTANSDSDVTWSLVSGDLPEGLVFNAEAGTITGTPTEKGSFVFTVKVENANGSDEGELEIVVLEAPKFITKTLPDAQVGQLYEVAVQLTGDPVPTLAVDESFALPTWLTLGEDGVLSGTPDKGGAASFVLVAENELGTVRQTLNLRIIEPVSFVTEQLEDAPKNAPYNATIETRGFPTPSLSVIDGSLPDGMALAEDGTLAGTPTVLGTYTFTVAAENTKGSRAERTFTLDVTLAAGIVTEVLPNAAVGKEYAAEVEVAGDPEPTLVLDEDAELPEGLTYDTETHVVSGTPAAGTGGTHAIAFVADNGVGKPAKRAVELNIAEEFEFVTESDGLPRAMQGTAYNASIETTGWPACSFTLVRGTLPIGLTLATDGTISGTPSGKSQVYTFTVRAVQPTTDVSSRVAKDRVFSITVGGAPSITAPAAGALARGVVGAQYHTVWFTASVPDAVFTVTSGALPEGLELTEDGMLSGTPVADGTFEFEVTASNALGSDTRSYSIAISELPVITTDAVLPSGQVGKKYSIKIEAEGEPAPTLKHTVGALPTGLTFDAKTGVISGTPMKDGTFRITITATNAGGSVERKFTLVVATDTAKLEAAIAKAGASPYTDKVRISKDGKDVDQSEKWVTKEAADGLATALAQAEDVIANGKSTQAQIDKATEALVAAMDAYKPAKGTMVEPAKVDKTKLNEAIAKAKASPYSDEVAISADGMDVTTTMKWVTAEAIAKLEAALSAALTVSADAKATQYEVDEATANLVAAMKDYKPTAGTKPDKSKLNEAIAKAGTSPYSDEVAVSTDGKNVPKTMKWVTEEAIEKLEAALSAALAVSNNDKATKEQIDKATKELNAAMDAYKPAMGTMASAWKRLAGNGALDTMAAIISEGCFEKGGTVVLASLEGYWDALTAAGIAGLYEAPVVMALQDQLGAQSAEVLKQLAPKQIVVCGGGYWIPDSVVAEAVKAAGPGCKSVRLAGDNAAQTAIKIFEAGKKVGKGWSDTAIIATSGTFQDALAAAPLSYAKHMPIFLAGFDFATETGSLAPETIEAMKKGGIKRAYIAGGTYWLPASVSKQLSDAGITVAKQLMGETAVETSGAIADEALGTLGMTAEGMGAANVAQHYDALASAAFCGKNNSVLLLVKDLNSSVISGFAKKHATEVAHGYVFGGTGSVTEGSMAELARATM